ncbi:3-isopropylmalate dehydratase small subunit [Microbacterium sp. H1-D42]|uniref:3-isopropylmalate dehydratase small subunit n=1 Tax=Microbacterium sp. H1-D42 TaxID=2925844 RepID=UPI001F534333|nr:3-isopropylmalate dehydratase small subunit [Microbacterium sp. H1-D42]UNK69430.1 3-isopropylmalate dehydratase small subunit [Microbacterium sp. H1-D42]
MEKFTTHTGVAAPLKRSNVDTDQIIPAVFLKRVTKTGFEDALFHAWRQDPEFVLNQQPFQRASVLVAGPDFGTGSSREHAVWALRDYGFKVVLSPRFADIFRGNSGKQGLLAATVDEADIERIWALIDEQPGRAITVDLEARTVTVPGATPDSEPLFQTAIGIDDYTRWRLLEGLDDIGLTLRNEDKIAQFEARRESWRPRTLPVR